MTRKRWIVILVSLSLPFAAVHLYRADCLMVPHIDSWWKLVASLLLLFAGFFWDINVSRAFIGKMLRPFPFRTVFPAFGINAFGGYIPGKVWGVLGIATYLSVRSGESAAAISLLLAQSQILSAGGALFLGMSGLFFLYRFSALQWILLALMAAGAIAFFTPLFYTLCEKTYLLLRRRAISLQRVPNGYALEFLLRYCGTWLLWGTGFSFLAAAMFPSALSWYLVCWYPLACISGAIVAVIPGGLGIREGVLVWLLVLSKVDLPVAITIAAAARLWSLIGTAVFFLAGLSSLRLDRSFNSIPRPKP